MNSTYNVELLRRTNHQHYDYAVYNGKYIHTYTIEACINISIVAVLY